MPALAQFSRHLAGLFPAVGTADFPERLVAMLQELVPCQDATIIFFPERELPVIEYFDGGGMLKIAEMSRGGALVEGFSNVAGLLPLVEASGIVAEDAGPEEVAAACELVLEALHAKRKISRTDSGYERQPSRRRPGADDSPFTGGLA